MIGSSPGESGWGQTYPLERMSLGKGTNTQYEELPKALKQKENTAELLIYVKYSTFNLKFIKARKLLHSLTWLQGSRHEAF